MAKITVAFDLSDDIEDEAHVDTMLQIIEAAMNLRIEHIASGQGLLHPVDWSNWLAEETLRLITAINRVGRTVKDGEAVPERHIRLMLQSLIRINAVSLGALQNLTYKELEYGTNNTTSDERMGLSEDGGKE